MTTQKGISEGKNAKARFEADRRGLQELLHGPDGPVAKEILRRSQSVERAAKRLCPVDTGRLRSSIGKRLEQRPDGPTGVIGSNVEYAVYVEFGTSRSPAQPFLRPALDAARGKR